MPTILGSHTCAQLCGDAHQSIFRTVIATAAHKSSGHRHCPSGARRPVSVPQLLPTAAIAIAGLFILSSSLFAQTPTLQWDPNSESDLAGYIIEYGTVATNPSTSLPVGNVTQRQITGLLPGSTYYFRVVAVNTSGQRSGPSNQVSYTVPIIPVTVTLTVVTPNSGPTGGGTVITLTGTNFGTTASVSVGGAAASNVMRDSVTSIRATTPPGTAGARTVQLTTNGQTVSLVNGFTYNAPSAPTLTSVTPSSGPTAGGTPITLTGTNFATGATVTVGGTAATGVTRVNSTTVTATTPAGTSGPKMVQITSNGQMASMANAFTYNAPSAPTLTSVTPGSGPTAGGTPITLTGTNFATGATVTVGGTAATGVTRVNSTTVTATTPAGTSGPKMVQITSNGQMASMANAFTYNAPSAPTLTSVTRVRVRRLAARPSRSPGPTSRPAPR